MDGSRFDQIARLLAATGIQRRSLAGLLGGVTLPLLLQTSTGARNRRGQTAHVEKKRKKKCQPDLLTCTIKKGKKKKRLCVDAQSDPLNCGACGNVCATAQTCQGGVCTCNGTICSGCCDGATCQAGTTPEQCGTAGAVCQVCSGGRSCQGGVCTCPGGQTFCGAECCSSLSPTCCDNALRPSGKSCHAATDFCCPAAFGGGACPTGTECCPLRKDGTVARTCLEPGSTRFCCPVNSGGACVAADEQCCPSDKTNANNRGCCLVGENCCNGPADCGPGTSCAETGCCKPN